VLLVVVDPGVLIAAFISGRGAPADLLRSWLAGHFELIVSVDLLAELSRVLARDKFRTYATRQEAEAYVALFHKVATLVQDPPPVPGLTSDPGDDYLVSLARAVGADVLVSGDKHLLDMRDPDPEVVTPRAFVGRFDRDA
jgi:putative PIN family toxin of toxin-antitoxin system